VGPGTLYPTLDRLEGKGLLTSRLGEPTPDRGGRAKRYFSLTPEGLSQARAAWRTMARLAEGMEGVLEPEGG
jgi:DNA-binding PadR family transcriptional regulator